jgi:hypothetical protein
MFVQALYHAANVGTICKINEEGKKKKKKKKNGDPK